MRASMEQELIVAFDNQVCDASAHSLAKYGASWGTLQFHDASNTRSNTIRQFLYIDGSVDSKELYQFMKVEWRLKPANMIIPVISAITNHRPFKKLKTVEALRIGIKNIVNTSEVWFITNGIDAGLPQLIGAVVQEDIAIRLADDAWAEQTDQSPKVWKALTLIGIVCDEEIKDVIDFITSQGKGKMNVKISATKTRDKYFLNSDHTHFIFIREQPIVMNSSTDTEQKSSTYDCHEKLIDLANSATNRFRDRFENFLCREVTQQSTTLPSCSKTGTQACTIKSSNKIGFPMVYILVRGTLGTIEILHKKLPQEVPTVILKGTGSAADIIAFVSDVISAKTNKSYEDDNLKTELARRLLDEYPTLKDNSIKRNEIRDHIIAVVKKNDKSKQKFLTLIDVDTSVGLLNDLHKIIFTAYLRSKKIVVGDKVHDDHMQLNLLNLTLDWGLVDLAKSEIFHRDDYTGYVIPDSLFEQALFGNDLEAFVDLFLERGFALHRYLTPESLLRLFRREENQDFFTTTSLEGILGESGDIVPDNLVEKHLNEIIKRLTGLKHIFNQYEMRFRSMGLYLGSNTHIEYQWQDLCSEKKALRHLVMYAVLTNRHNLVKILWKRSAEPISLALVCSMMLNNLSSYCRESYLQSLIKKQAKELSDCATGVLDKLVTDDEARVFKMLEMSDEDWGHMTVVHLAYNSDNKEFMAHPIIQKWVTRKFYGEITPKELSWGFFRCPDHLKILLSACLIFPMRFWISFSPIGQVSLTSERNIDLLVEKKIDLRSDSKHQDDRLRDRIGEARRGCFPRLTPNSCRKQRRSTDDNTKNCFQQIRILWSAPITKFYTNFVAYLLFLLLFTLAVMWPSCGNLILDRIVWIWAALIAVENIRSAYVKHYAESNLPLKGVLIEIILQVIFLSLYLGVRIIGLWSIGTSQILTAKAILGFGLIYYYYRILFVFLPISSKIGPMMIRLQYMVTDDFLTFLRLFIIFMISSGVAITAVLYPHHPLGWKLFSKAFVFRGLMALFVSDLSDLKNAHQQCTINPSADTEGKHACSHLSHSFRYDNISAYNQYGISSPFCNQTSWVAWLLLIQYFFLATRFLISLLTALFSITGGRVQRQSEQIWFYNRYEILVEYIERSRLPPPFVVISYAIRLIRAAYRQFILRLHIYSEKRSIRRTNAQLRRPIPNDTDVPLMPTLVVYDPKIVSWNVHLATKPSNDLSSNSNDDNSIQKYWKDNEANAYWKQKAKEYFIKSGATEKTKDKSDSSVNVQKDIEALQKSLQQTNDRVVTLEKMMIHSHILLEKMCTTVLQEDQALPENLKKFVHNRSRISPYVHTNYTRFPVTDKFVSWEIPFESYDPTMITLPEEDICFSDNDRSFVEPDFLELNSSEIIESQTTPDVTNDFNSPLSEQKWNQIVELQLSDNNKMIVDRRSWITQSNDKTSTSYQLDAQLLVPLNPLGRTGVQGRGALIRWGPNKSIIAVITQWKKRENDFVTVEGNRILEAMVFTDKDANDWNFPEAKILSNESPYAAICRVFSELAFQSETFEHSSSFQTEENMIQFFESFSRSEKVTDRTTKFQSRMIHKGYIDDVRNTDNAWMESEIWNFHYGSTTSFPPLRNDETVLWENVTHNLRVVSIHTSILRKIARIHDAYFE